MDLERDEEEARSRSKLTDGPKPIGTQLAQTDERAGPLSGQDEVEGAAEQTLDSDTGASETEHAKPTKTAVCMYWLAALAVYGGITAALVLSPSYRDFAFGCVWLFVRPILLFLVVPGIILILFEIFIADR